MNEQNESGETPPPIFSTTLNDAARPEPPGPSPYSHWARRLLACNPFYLVSAALLLYGVYRVSVDPGFLTKEFAQLVFNFTSLQFYEVLLVVTAIVLARRRIWYDSTLLVSLENLLVFVPFILISQAALIDRKYVWLFCGLGGAIAILRFGGLKGFIAELNLPRRTLGLGLALLIVNVALPVIYRILHETKFGTKPDWGAAYHMNQFTWLLILPAVLALGNFLPFAKEAGKLLPQHRWLPIGWFSLWITATVVHLYCLGYVYDFDLRAAWVAPAVWMLAWTARRRAHDFFPEQAPVLRYVLMIPPVAATLLAAAAGGKNEVFLALNLLNAAVFAGICFSERDNRLARHLLFASVFLFIAGLPREYAQVAAPEFSRGKFVASGLVAYLILWAALLRNPKLALLGSVALAGAVAALLHGRPDAFHWAAQSGFVFLLLHSLRWDDFRNDGARAVRWIAGVAWVAHSFAWMHTSGEVWTACLPGAVVLGICLMARLFRGGWGQIVLPIAAGLVFFTGPLDALAGVVAALPGAVLAVGGSFLCFGLGTVAALTKHRWHHPGQQ